MGRRKREPESPEEFWGRQGPAWQAECLIDETKPRLGSWLVAAPTSEGQFALGCKICSQQGGASGNLAKFMTMSSLQLGNLRKHHNSASHKKAARLFAAGEMQERELKVSLAPSAESFAEILADLKDNKPLFSTRKSSKMVWCLAEAMKAADQKFLAEAEAIALFRDERKGRVALRFKAVTADLRVLAGTLGQEKNPGTGGRNLALASLKVLKRACSRFAAAPYKTNADAFTKMDLLQHVRMSVTSITVDSASDELLASELMRSRQVKVSQEMQTLTPNLKFVVRDKTHASRRITSRPWQADSALAETLKHICSTRGSIARLIEFSPEIKRVFQEYAAQSDCIVRSAVVNMRAAAHRFESHAKPLGRTCLFIHAALRTALHVAKVRSDQAGAFAKRWLEWVDEEQCLQAAMLADAADSSLAVTRVLDAEDTDPARVCDTISLYLDNIRGLFDQGKVLEVFGYTNTMLKTLSRPLVFQLGGSHRTLGSEAGVAADIQERCLKRMQAWTKLAASAIEAEFPAFEITQVSGCWDLDFEKKPTFPQNKNNLHFSLSENFWSKDLFFAFACLLE